MDGHLQKVNNERIIIITGQTGTGKTSLALNLLKDINGALISFDSRQCYKGMDIITGKDTDQFVYMYDEYDPKERVNAYDYIYRADGYIKSIIQSGKVPIIVGGTMFYIKSYLEGLYQSSLSVNWNHRIELEKKSVADLQKKLQTIDKETFEKMNQSDRLNKRRIIRAIERTQERKMKNRRMIINQRPFLLMCLIADNLIIKSRIKERVKERLKKGAIEEVELLMEYGYTIDDPGMKTMGYSHIYRYLQGEISLKKATELWMYAEYHYAKRQKVFLTQFLNKHVFNMNDDKLVEKVRELVYKWVYYGP